MNSDIKWGTIVPLIGGMVEANKNKSKTNPAFLISYPAFKANDYHCLLNNTQTPYILLSPDTNLPITNINTKLYEDVDFVSAVCPCAGLSMLNTMNDSKSSKSRGGDAEQNDWLYKSANYVLEKIRPRVFWGENAPGLYTGLGEKVSTELFQIAKKHGYSFTIIKTDSYLHGIPQKRVRSFYFFWRDTLCPILECQHKESPSLIDYIKMVPENAEYNKDHFYPGTFDLSDDIFINFIKAKNISFSDIDGSVYKYIIKNNLTLEFQEYVNSYKETKQQIYLKTKCINIQKKIDSNKGYWDPSPKIVHDYTPAIISKNSYMYLPELDRGISYREAMWLMGLPNDYKMKNSIYGQVITQNVPVQTAEYWTGQVLKYINGELEISGFEYVKQNNINKKMEYAKEKEYMPISLF